MKKLVLMLGVAALVASPALAEEDLTSVPTDFTAEVVDFTGPIGQFDLVEPTNVAPAETAEVYEEGLDRVETRLPRTDIVVKHVRTTQDRQHWDPNSIYHNQMFDDTDAVNNRNIRPETIYEGDGKGRRIAKTDGQRGAAFVGVRGGGRDIRGYGYGRIK